MSDTTVPAAQAPKRPTNAAGSEFLSGVPVMALLLAAGPLLLPEYRDPAAGCSSRPPGSCSSCRWTRPPAPRSRWSA
ncbi:hypothetical protein C1I98_31360 [Spongiactinospora gelatinilytica]|uniref:Uncharacterized protein n=1 Tax=Spongiactinospora gelatinilytica TaxID=2666298 RepID=A0A2W2FZN9_9ACTN|nr:hypothetical protein [Spongiactinospora gelatinilytica]PZG30128.1 hypothetical protein C1I98_31360 [Spongiactinospora gelatinilytica]